MHMHIHIHIDARHGCIYIYIYMPGTAAALSSADVSMALQYMSVGNSLNQTIVPCEVSEVSR